MMAHGFELATLGKLVVGDMRSPWITAPWPAAGASR
jgi:hypothetical protein